METLDLRPLNVDSKIKIVTDNGIVEGHIISFQLQQEFDFRSPRVTLSLEIICDNKDTVRIDKEIDKKIDGPGEEIITI